MILSTKYEVLKSVQLEIVYDDETSKCVEIGIDDEVRIIYNKDGLRSTVIGRVAGIDNDPHIKPYPHEDFWRHPVYRGPHPKYYPNTCWIFIDASIEGNSYVARVDARQIIDVDILKKHSDKNNIVTPDDETAIRSMRYKNGLFQISQDGTNWITIGAGTPDEGGEGESSMPTTKEELTELIKEILRELKPEHKPHHHHCDCDEETINKLIDLVRDLTVDDSENEINEDPQTPDEG